MKALILAAGFGSRMVPVTDNLPKPLIPVLNAPVIEYNIHFLKHYGVREFFINLHHGADKIESALGNGKKYGIKIIYLKEKDILGTGGAIGSLKDLVDDTFIVINSDTVFDFDFEQIVDMHKSGNELVTLGLLRADSNDSRAVITVDDNGKIVRMIDKSHFSPLPEGNAVFTGLHIIEPKLIEYIPSDVFVSITSYVYSRMVESRDPLNGFFIDGEWWDMGTPESYFKCNFELMNHMPLHYFNPFEKFALSPQELKKEKLVVMGDEGNLPAIPINPPVILGNSVKIENVNQIGPNLIVGNNVYIDGNTDTINAIYLSGSKGLKKMETSKGVIYF